MAGLVIILYLAATSSVFLKAFILPRVGQALQAKVTAEEIGLSPFSQISLRQLRLQTTGTEPLVTAGEARVRYSLTAILGGTIDVSEVTLTSPVVQIIEEADGTSNLDPLLKGKVKSATTPKTESVLQLAIRNVALKGGTIRFIQKAKDGSVQTTEMSNVDVTLDQLKNGTSGKLILGTDLRFSVAHPASAKVPNDRLESKLTGTFEVGLNANLAPQTLKANARVDLAKAEGAFQELAGLAALLQADATPTEIRQMALRFERGGQGLGQITLSGPLDVAKAEGHLNLAVQSIDRQVMNLLGAKQGWDFGGSTLNVTNVVDLGQKGSVIGATGRIAGRQISLRQKNQVTPVLNLDVEYQVSVDLGNKTAAVQKFTVLARQDQQEVLTASLDRPMSVAWGNAAGTLPDSNFQLALHQLNLASWQAVLGTNLPTGQVDLQLNVQALRDGKQLAARLVTTIQDLAFRFGTNALERAEIRAEAAGEFTDFKIADLKQFQLELRRKNQSAVKSSGTARVDLAKNEMTFESDTEVALPGLIEQFPMPGVEVSSGALRVHAQAGQREGKQTILASISLTNFTGGSAEYRVQNFQTTADASLLLEGSDLQILRAGLSLREGAGTPSTVEMAGRYHLTNQAGQMTFKIVDLNTNILRLALGPALGGIKLASASVSGSGSARYDPQGESSIKGEFNFDNWIVDDPQKRLPNVPVGAQFQMDGSFRSSVVTLKQCVASFRQGAQPAGRFDVTAQYNVTNHAGQMTYQIADLNQAALGLALAGSLGELKLVSIAVNGAGSASYDPKGDAAVKADLKISNWVMEDPLQTLPKTPLSAEFQLDGSVRQETLDLKQLSLTLSPTQRAQNQMQLQGKVDFKKTNAAPSQLSLKAASLDLTPFYDLFAGSGAAKKTPPPTPGAPAVTAPATEPVPVVLPLQQLTADVKVDRFYLREIVMTNLQTTVKVNRGDVVVKPLQFSLNGGSVTGSAALNVGVPGYTYDVAIQADRIPMEPIVNSFSTNAPGHFKGDLIAQAQVKGAGTLGKNLQKNLSGQVFLSLTNMNLDIVGAKIKRLLEPIALVLRVPELTATPLNWVNAKAEIGQGKVTVSQFGVMSQAFSANGQGTVQMAEVLTNSTLEIPVTIALRRSLAAKANLLSADAPATAAYVSLPSFAKLAGTLGDPKTEVNKLVISGLLLRSAGGIPQVGGKAGGILQGIGGMLTGEKPLVGGTNSLVQTNVSSGAKTNKPAKLNPLDLLRLLPDKNKN